MSGHNRFYTIDELTRRERGFVEEIKQLREQLTTQTARADALADRLKTIVLAIGSHACSGRDCIGIYTKMESATQYKCTKCELVAEALEDKP